MNKTLIYILVALVVLGGGAYFLSRPSVQVPGSPTGMAGTPTIAKAVMSRGVDAGGNATNQATTFSAANDKIIYAVLSMQNASAGTKLSYIRYLNGKYVDSKVAVISKNNTPTFYFTFEKGIGNYPTGNYTLKLYVNGQYSQSLNYIFQ